MKLGREQLRGIIAPVVAPWTKDEKLDEKVLRREVKYLLSTGIHGISPGGSTGEGQLVHTDELVRMVEIIQEENTKHIPVVTGIIRHSTRDAIDAGLKVKKAGADVLMVTPIQYLGGTDDDGNYEYYERISDACDLPMIIYNVVPENPITAKMFSRILNIGNMVGIKQSVGGIEALYEMKMVNGDRANVYAATDDMMYSCFDLGADGAIAAILTMFPDFCVQMWDAVQKGDVKTAKEIQNRLYFVYHHVKGTMFPRRVKESLNQIGREVGIAASPLSDASKMEKEAIHKALANAKLI